MNKAKIKTDAYQYTEKNDILSSFPEMQSAHNRTDPESTPAFTVRKSTMFNKPFSLCGSKQ